ncbi:glutamate receptor ionotropic, delta-2-like isoform X3 [Palaemon carinicauda]|uniref:glutamate receptor ionotropic, delta-2-like isoform X3 n=1 Tax=Palaemon carinicauda TaxID=392227 RepID=UPI0035B5F43F
MFPISMNSFYTTLAVMMVSMGSGSNNVMENFQSPDANPLTTGAEITTSPPNHHHRNISVEDVMIVVKSVVKNSNGSLTFLYGQEYEEIIHYSIKLVAQEFIVLMNLRNDGETKTFRRVLSSSGNSFVLLLDTPANIVSLFQKMRKARLQTHLTKWLLLLEGDDALNSVVRLQEFVNEGTLVVIFVKTSDGHMVHFLPSVDSDGVTRYKAYIPKDDVWGDTLSDGNVTGIIGMVARREVTLGASTLTMSESRMRAVHFAHPYLHGNFLLISRTPKEKNRALAVLSPFQLQIWICITSAVLLMGPIVYLITYVINKYVAMDGKAIDYQWFHYNIFRNVINQGNFIQEESLPVRVVLAFWFLFCLINAALYSGMLTAVLAIPAYETPINSLQDLPKATKEGFTVGTLAGSHYESIFKTATEGIFKQTWDLFNHNDRSKSFVSGTFLAARRILDEKFVFITSDNIGRLFSTMFGSERFHLSKERFLPSYIGIACQKGSPVNGALSRVFLKMKEGGIVDKILDDHDKLVPVDPSAKQVSNKKSPSITLTHLQAAFYIFLFGTLVSNAAFLMEIITYRSIKTE